MRLRALLIIGLLAGLAAWSASAQDAARKAPAGREISVAPKPPRGSAANEPYDYFDDPGVVSGISRPLGATVGDFLDKPVSNGGLALSRPIASVAIGVFIIVCILVLPQRAGRHPGQSKLAS